MIGLFVCNWHTKKFLTAFSARRSISVNHFHVLVAFSFSQYLGVH